MNAIIIAATNKPRAVDSKAGNFRWSFYDWMAVTEHREPKLASRIPEPIAEMFEYLPG